MKLWLFSLVALGSSAFASDFSALGRPEVVRYTLVPFPRQVEKQCAALAVARGAQDQYLTAALRSELAEAVTARLAIDIGSREVAKGALDDFVQGLVDDPTDPFPGARTANLAALQAQCPPFFAKVRVLGVPRALSPAPTGPIALPDAPTCLAAMQEADRRKFDLGQDQGEGDVARMLLVLPPAAEVASNRAVLADAAGRFAAHPPARDELEMTINFTCLPAFAELAKRFPPRIEDLLER